MSFYRKLRKLVRNPRLFFEDAKKNKVASLAVSVAKKAAPAASSDFSTWIAYSESVRRFSSVYPVNVVKYRGFHMWPALRFYIWLRLICAIWGKSIKGKNLITASPGMVWRECYEKEYGAISVDDLDGALGSVDFLVFSNQNSVDLCKVGNVSYNRLTDPLCERLAKYGRVQKVELLKGQGPLPKSRHITPQYIMPPIVRTTRHHLLVDGLAQAIPVMVKAFPKAELTEGIINFYIDEFFYQKEIYKKILAEYKPRCAFLHPMDYSFPLIMACKECGVQAIDIQHGNHVGFNLPYNHWDEAPPKGYDLFPDAFLAWGIREKMALSRNLPSTRIITAGYPWLDYFNDLRENNSSIIEKALAKAGGYNHVVVVTMRDQIDFPQLLHAIVTDPRAEATGTVFLIKPHPKNDRLKDVPESRTVLMPRGIKEVSIAGLAKYVNLHITVNSSSIFEFEYYGIPSFVFGDEPLVDYADLIEEGRLKYLESSDDFYYHLGGLGQMQEFPVLIDNNSTELHEYLVGITA